MKPTKDQVLDAALPHVAFDGWSDTTLEAAISDTGLTMEVVSTLFPAGGVDLAAAFHRRADAQLADFLLETDLSSYRYSERVALAIRRRLELVEPHKEAVRRGAQLFALPHNAATGVKLIWETADTIWTGLDDRSDDLNWYTKRAILSGVYSSVTLFWLGDSSEAHEASWRFLNRRIEDVMRFEKTKAAARSSSVLKPLTRGLDQLTSWIKAPNRVPRDDLPGHVSAGAQNREEKHS